MVALFVCVFVRSFGLIGSCFWTGTRAAASWVAIFGSRAMAQTGTGASFSLRSVFSSVGALRSVCLVFSVALTSLLV